MPKTKISEFSSTPASNTDIDSINIAEGCAPSGINDAIRELMAQLKDFQTGAVGDSFNGPVGTTTAAAGAFTTLAASGAVTLSGGTANGVTYLNGSKVVTSGSALTFNGTNLGVGSSDYGNAGSINLSVGVVGTTSGGVQLWSNTTAAHSIQWGDGTTGSDTYRGAIEYSHNGDSMRFYTSATEQMRLTSTGLGIGTSSPSQKLEVAGNMYINTSGNPYLQIKTSGAGNNPYIRMQADTNYWDIQSTFSNTNDDLLFQYNGTALLDLDKNGNLGLGVTPTSNSLGPVYQNKNAVFVADGSTPRFWLGSNWYNNSGDKYIVNGFASLYSQQSGQHIWWNAPTGTAGDAITFTQAMTLDASGNLLVGSTSSPSTVWSGSRTFAYVKGGTAGNGGEVIVESNNGNQQASFFASAITAEFGLWSTKASAILFGTNNTEGARIDSSGNLLVGTTSQIQSGKQTISFNASTHNGLVLSDSNNTTSGRFISFNLAGTAIGSIERVAATSAVVYNTTSDQRLKSNITNANPILDKLMTVKVRQYDWTEGSLHQDYGFIAQELEPTLSGVVTKGKTDDDMWQLDYSRLTPHLVKAIQEQQAVIESLKARLDAANL